MPDDGVANNIEGRKPAHREELAHVLITVRNNLSSLMAAYPDRFPRHAFQGTYDLICATVGTYDQVPTSDG